MWEHSTLKHVNAMCVMTRIRATCYTIVVITATVAGLFYCGAKIAELGII